MMKRLFLLSAVYLMSMLLAFGCGDDKGSPNIVILTDTLIDTITVIDTVSMDTVIDTQVVSPANFVTGFTTIAPYLTFAADIYPTASQLPTVDSAGVGDSIVTPSFGLGFYNEIFANVVYDNSSDLRFSSGETIHIDFFAGNDTSSVDVVLLDFFIDTAKFIQPTPSLTLPLGTAITVEWNSVPFADWYVLFLMDYAAGSGKVDTALFLAFSDDTLEILGTAVHDGSMDIFLMSVTGPGPTSTGGNITGPVASGIIHSLTNWVSRRIFFGTGTPDPTPGVPPDPKEVLTRSSDRSLKVVTEREEGSVIYLNR